MKNKTIVTNIVCFCSSTMLTSKIIKEIIENNLNFLRARKAAVTIFQVNLDKLRNNL